MGWLLRDGGSPTEWGRVPVVVLGEIVDKAGSRRAVLLNTRQGRLQALALNLQSRAFDVEAWIGALVDWYARELNGQAEIHIACYEAFLAAARTARHRAVVVEWFETWRRSAELALKAAGSDEPRRHAELFVAALIGILLQQLATPRRGFRQEAKAALLELVGGLIAKA